MPRNKTRTRGYTVFISHSTNDRWIAKQISEMIEARGRRHRIKTFLDEKDIEGGDSIHEAILRNVRNCDEFLVLLSRYSINRPWVLVEIGAAWALGKRIVAITDKVTPDALPDVLAYCKAIDLNDLDEYLKELFGRARAAREKT